jgi:glycosyltransferase involved in cell wall biosynthesis
VKILLVHNPYQQRGGEDAVFEDEHKLLAEHGHEVRVFQRSNFEIDNQPRWLSAAEALWSRQSEREVAELLAQWQPDLMHVHNTFPLVSPAVIWAASRARVPVVATLHNFRLACLEGTFMRQGTVCEDCLGKVPWRGIARACYRGSTVQSSVLAASLVSHRLLRTWRQRVQRFIVLSDYSVPKFVAMGLPAERLCVKPNFAWTVPATDTALRRMGGLFVGRLSMQKGVGVLAQALRLAPELSFKVIGLGPDQALLEGGSAQVLGAQAPQAVLRHMQASTYVVIPSVTQEQFPRVLAEAYAAGTPVIAAARGPLVNLVQNGQTGLLVKPEDAVDLAEKMQWADSHPEEMAQMGRQAREVHANTLSPRAAYASLMDIYKKAGEDLSRQTKTGSAFR